MVLFSFVLNISSKYDLIRECLTSFSSQSFDNFEIIILNSYNEDINEVINSFKDKLNILEISDKKELFSFISGEYVCFLNSYDVLVNNNSLKDISLNIIDSEVNMFSVNNYNTTNISFENIFYNTKSQRIFNKVYSINEEISFLSLHTSFFRRDFLLNAQVEYNDNPILLFSNILSKINYFLGVPVDFCQDKNSDNITSDDCISIFRTYKSLIHILKDKIVLNQISHNLIYNKFHLPYFSSTAYEDLKFEFLEIKKLLKTVSFDCSHDVLNYLRYIKEMAEIQVKEYEVSISIIIPTFNVEKFIDDCLNSIINQSFSDFEVIVVDDCSSDATLDIVDEYSRRDNRIRYFKNDRKCGSGGSRNFGLKQARGKYVQFVDGDDWLDHDALEKLYELAEKYDAQTVMFKVINFEDNGTRFIKDNYLALSCLDKFDNSIFNSNRITDELFEISVVAMNKLYLRSFLEDIDARFPEKYIHQDNPFFYQTFCESERIYLADMYLYNRRLWHGSITHKRDDTELGTIEIVEEILKVFLDNGLYDKFKEFLLNRLLFKLRNRYRLVGREYKKEYYMRAKAKLEKFFFEYNLFDDFVGCLWDENRLFFDRLVFSESFEEFDSF